MYIEIYDQNTYIFRKAIEFVHIGRVNSQ